MRVESTEAAQRIIEEHNKAPFMLGGRLLTLDYRNYPPREVAVSPDPRITTRPRTLFL